MQRHTASLSIVIPCFNEAPTLRRCVERVLALRNEVGRLEVVIVDDASTDGSLEIANLLVEEHAEIALHRHARNRGKGAAVRTGVGQVSGDYVAIQDADLEYDPREIPELLEPLVDGRADVVYGSRFLNGRPQRGEYIGHYLFNRSLTALSNMFNGLHLSDMETCYKVFSREVLQGFQLEEDRFGFDPEVTAKVAQTQFRICEVPISYTARTYREGKKIGWRDGLRAVYCIFSYNPFARSLLKCLGVAVVGVLLALYVMLR